MEQVTETVGERVSMTVKSAVGAFVSEFCVSTI